MPYELRESGANVDVVNTETGEVKATHAPPDARQKAERQVKLLQSIEADPGWAEE